MGAPRTIARAISYLGMAAVCGCGGGSSAPTSTPSPTPTPTVAACDVIGGAVSGSIGILNGTACSPGNSSVVLVNLRDAGGSPSGACSGTVIAPRAVLTAAHCLVGDTAAVRIYPGTGNEILAESFRAFPNYRESDPATLDVGVVLTMQDINRVPIRLLLSRDARVGEQAVVAGWGRDELGNGTILRAGTTTISAITADVLQTQFSTGSSSVCSGDSGGPLLLSEGGVWAVAGVTSAVTVSGSCTAGTNFYANIRNSSIMSFITGLVPNAGRQ
jgi:V8-like Glu-specific endopeptidase